MLSPVIQIINAVAYIVGLIIPVLIGIALIVFFWGLVAYVWKSGEEKAAAEGKRIMGAGLLALFIMVSVWGIIAFAQSALGIRGNASAPQNAPYIPSYAGNSINGPH